LYLLWGWLIFICCIVQFIAVSVFDYSYGYYIWFSTWILLIYQIFFLAKKRKVRKVKTYTGEINAAVWLVFFISLILVIFIGNFTQKYEIIYPILLILYGMPTFLSGVILKFKPLITGGICCWICSILSVFITLEYQLLIIATAVVAAWLIPGYLLRKKYKKEN
jgi:hypothetical protein